MAIRDLYSNIEQAQSLAPAAKTATANGAGVDLRGAESATILVDVGAWTDGTHTISLAESDDNSTFTAVAAADLLGTAPVISSAPTASQVYRFGYRGDARYIRVVTTVSGATTGAVYGAHVVKGHLALVPAA